MRKPQPSVLSVLSVVNPFSFLDHGLHGCHEWEKTACGAQTTTYAFDELGRVVRTTHPDEATVTNEYELSGELKRTVGARVYPVEYAYDAQGRMTNMSTWQDYSGNSGKATTRWQFDAQRGFLTNKVYQGQSTSLGYTYTPGGRLLTRRWERGVYMTNIYNNAGEVVTNRYSDGTSNVVYHLDRLGRRTNIVDGTGTRLLAYTDSGLLLSEAHTAGVLNGLKITNGYDGLLRRTSTGFLTNGTSFVVSPA